MTEKPQTKPVDAGYLPDKLCNTARFCNWRYESRDDRWTKVPYNPRTGRRGDSTDPDAFADLDTAIEAEPKHDGIGIGLFDNLAAIDIDHCVDESGEVSSLAKDIIDTMDAYTEKSPSGTGVRILFTVPNGFDYDSKDTYYIKNTRIGLEVYVAGKTNRFVTVTGDAMSEGRDLEERGDQLSVVLDKYMQKPKRDEETHTNVQPVTDARKYTDEEVFNELMCDERAASLFNGDVSGYPSPSEADLALCGILASWTCRDPERIDRLFRMSGLYRDKWDRADYRKRTIDEAIRGCKYIHVKGDQPKQEPADSPASVLHGINVGKYLESGGMETDIDYFKKYRFRKIGFPCLDEHLTLYPGLAAFGGGASIGKSTFLINVADNLVMDRETVLFFSFEQTPVELVSKSLARRLAERCPGFQDKDNRPEAYLDNVRIKNGRTNDELERVKQRYAEDIKDRFYIIPCNFRTTAEDVKETVEAFIRDHDVRPIVIIDYLQLVAPPENFKGDQRAAIDHNIKLFKTMQLANELLVILVSNFNRSGYNTPVTYADFKETSMIEFTCDYIWGLQLSVLSEERFYYRIGPQGGKMYTTEIEKDEMIDDAMSAYPKKVQFVSLKNRNGKQRFRGNFDYFNDSDYFRDNETVNPFEEDVTTLARI